MQFLQITNLLD